MPTFMDLSRELRDMIYMAILTDERATPTMENCRWEIRKEQSGPPRRYEYFRAVEKPPTTCANFICCSRQIYQEMTEAIAFAKERGELCAVKLDCIAHDPTVPYLTWLRIPFVKTTKGEETKSGPPAWPHTLLQSLLVGARLAPAIITETRIHQLWVDIRLVHDLPKTPSIAWGQERIDSIQCWRMLKALTDLLENGSPDFSTSARERPAHRTEVDELVLNVISPEPSEVEEHPPTYYSQRQADKLVSMWYEIWVPIERDLWSIVPFQILLERIKRVRVCVDGETWKVRDLKLELERGQAEARRHAIRFFY